MRRIACLTLLLLVPSIAQAQRHKIYVRSDCCMGNRFSLEPYAGAVKDPFDISPDDKNTSPLYGFRVGYLLGHRTRLLGNVGYSKSENVSNPQGLGSYFVYDNTWVFTTGGAEFDIVPGRTSAALGIQGGAAWRRVDNDGAVGVPTEPNQADRGFSATALVVPSLALRFRATSRLAVMASLHDNIFLSGPAQHGVGATLGVSFR